MTWDVGVIYMLPGESASSDYQRDSHRLCIVSDCNDIGLLRTTPLITHNTGDRRAIVVVARSLNRRTAEGAGSPLW